MKAYKIECGSIEDTYIIARSFDHAAEIFTGYHFAKLGDAPREFSVAPIKGEITKMPPSDLANFCANGLCGVLKHSETNGWSLSIPDA